MLIKKAVGDKKACTYHKCPGQDYYEVPYGQKPAQREDDDVLEMLEEQLEITDEFISTLNVS